MIKRILHHGFFVLLFIVLLTSSASALTQVMDSQVWSSKNHTDS